MEEISTNGSGKSKDDISFVEIANAVLRSWRVVVVLPILLAVAAGAWSLTRDRKYVASASFVPQSSDNRSAGDAAALAEQFGVNLMTDRPGQSPEFYVDMLRSDAVLSRVVTTPFTVPAVDGGAWHGTLVDFWKVKDRGGVPAWRRAATKLNERISASVRRETGVVSLAVLIENPKLAEQVTQRALDVLNALNLQVRQVHAQEENEFVSARVAEAKPELLRAEQALQTFLQENRTFSNSPQLSFQRDRLQREVDMRQELYTSLLRSQQQARIDAVRNIPTFAVIDHPAGTAEPKSRKTVVHVVLSFGLGLVLAVLLAFAGEYTRRNREAGDPEFRELIGLAGQAWHDLKHPRRWVRKSITVFAVKR